MRACFWVTLLALAVTVELTACRSSAPNGRTAGRSVPVLAADTASAAGLSAQDASDAAKLYTAKCARCHKFYAPTAYSDGEWRSWMNKMSKKAKLKPDQEKLLARYLDAFRSANPADDRKTNPKP